MNETKSSLRKKYKAISSQLQNSFDPGQLRSLRNNLIQVVSAHPGSWGGYREIQGEPALALTEWNGPGEWLFPKVQGERLEYRRPILGSKIALTPTSAKPATETSLAKSGAKKDNSSSWIRSDFGIWEPSDECELVPLDKLQGVILPGLAFDSFGTRLGYGKGFYDKTLSSYKGLIVGIAWDEQICESALPFENHDIRCQIIITPTRLLEITAKV